MNQGPRPLDADLGRLAALRESGLLDTPPELAFDRLTRLATRLLHLPVSLVSLVDEDRQFFKSCVGLPEPWATERETPLSHSFCQHVVDRAEPLIIEDARDHPLVRENLAIRDLGVVAYAGIPLTTSDGDVLGSFCAIDTRPRKWTDDDIELLATLAESVMTEVELRRAERTARRRLRELEILHRLSEAAARADRVEDACEAVLHAVGEALGTDRAALVLPAEGGSPGVRCSRGVAESLCRASEQVEAVAAGASARESFVVEDVGAWEGPPALRGALLDEGIGSLVVIPMPSGRLSGRIEAYLDDPRSFRPSELRLAETVVRHAAATLERKRAEQALREKRIDLAESERLFRNTVDALSPHIAILDDSGCILAVNAAWRGSADGGDLSEHGPGEDYLAYLERAAEAGDEAAARSAEGIRSVLGGERERFALEYPAPGADEERWFLLRVTRFSGDGPARAVVAHENITLLYTAREAIREREERFRLALDAGRLGTWDMHLDTRQSVWDARAQEIFGVDADGPIPLERTLEVIHPDDRREAEEELARAVSSGSSGSYEIEKRVLSPDGEIRWISIRGRVLFDGEGAERRPARLLGTVADVTDRLEAERDLRRAREEADRRTDEIRLLLESTHEGIYGIDIRGCCTFINRAGAALLGFTPAECLGRNMHHLVHHHHSDGRPYPEELCPIFRAFEQGESVLVDDEVLWRKDGSCFPAEYSSSPLIKGEKVLGAVVTFLDVTERRRQETRTFLLAETGALLGSTLDVEERLRELARLCATTLADYCVVDRVRDDGRIERIDVFHRDPAHAEGARRLHDFPPTLDGSSSVGRVIASGEPLLVARAGENELRNLAAGPEHLASIRDLAPRSFMILPLKAGPRVTGAISLFATDPGRVYDAGDLVFAKDLAERAALAIENARLYEESAQAVRDREDVLAVVSHDLRNPLHTITLASGLLLEPEILPERKLDQAAIIRRAVDQMSRLIQDLLDVTRIASGQIDLERKEERPGEVIDEAVSLVVPLADAKSLTLRVEVGADVPAFRVDRQRLLQVLANLLGNAIKFTPEGGWVAVRAGRVDDGLEIRVEDSGPGIEPADLPRVFDRFWQSRRQKRGGAGLGLAIARGIVEAHGGGIRVVSEPGRGAEFIFTIPR